VPTIGICFAENQRMNLEGWQDKRFIEYIGWYGSNNLWNKLQNSLAVLTVYEERVKSSHTGRNCVDGKGIENIIQEIKGVFSEGIGFRK
jgi:spore coat polysaccharide biosynthesis predicted glycosyltransferase SpsG